MNANFDTLTYSKELIEASEKPEVAEVYAQGNRMKVNDHPLKAGGFKLRLKAVLSALWPTKEPKEQ